MDAHRQCCVDCWPDELVAVSTQGQHSVVPIPDRVVDVLLGRAGRFVVSAHSFGSKYANVDRSDLDEDDESDKEEKEEEEEEDAAATAESQEAVEAFERLLDAEIARLGGTVLPKCNWSAPKDATWMSADETLRCRTGAQVMLLLRSSDEVVSDIEFARAHGIVPHVCLKQWRAVSPSLEFRCFVLAGQLRGIAQRNMFECYPFLKDHKDTVRSAVTQFFADKVAQPLKSLGDCLCFLTFSFSVPFFINVQNNNTDLLDVYLDEDMRKVHVLDIAPLTEDLNRLVGEPFAWQALQEQQTGAVPVAVVESKKGIQPAPRSLCGVPVDIRDATSDDVNELIRAMQREHFHETHHT